MAGYSWRGSDGSISEDDSVILTGAFWEPPAKAEQQPDAIPDLSCIPDASSAAHAHAQKHLQDTMKTPEKLNQKGIDHSKSSNTGDKKDKSSKKDNKDDRGSKKEKENKDDKGSKKENKGSKKENKEGDKKDKGKGTGKKRPGEVREIEDTDKSKGEQGKATPRKRPAASGGPSGVTGKGAPSALPGPLQQVADGEHPAEVKPSSVVTGSVALKQFPRTFAGRERPTGADLQFVWDELRRREHTLKETMGTRCVNQVTLFNEVRDLFKKEKEGSQDDRLNQALTKFAKSHGCDLQFTQ